MRKKVIAANWKMFKTPDQATAFFQDFLPLVHGPDNKEGRDEIVICPTYLALDAAIHATKGSNVAIGAQNLHWEKEGAFTGEVNAAMLVAVGVTHVIIGHSERRGRGHESDQTCGERFAVAIKAGLKPIFCMGETLREYEEGLTDSVTVRQLNAVIDQVGVHGLLQGILAYEPVWAIGTGKAASPQHAQNILSFLRGHIALLDEDVAENVRILYGGSVNAENAANLFSMPDIDGGLVGGASLVTESFVAICEAANLAGSATGTAPSPS